jgi:hypothetical protein
MNSKLRMQLAMSIIVAAIGTNALAQSTALTGTFDANKISYVAADDAAKSLVTQSYSDVPDMLVWFEVIQGQAVKVDFSAAIAGQNENALTLRMVFDENPGLVIEPAKVTLRPTSKLDLFCATFLLPLENGLGPGGHNVRIHWRAQSTSQVVSTHRTLVVQHN